MKTLNVLFFILMNISWYGIHGQTSNHPTAPVRWYLDADKDGFGDVIFSVSALSKPYGYVANAKDRNDSDASCFEGAPDICDGKDNDFDGITDEESFLPELFPSDSTGLKNNEGLPVYCTTVGDGFTYTWFKNGIIMNNSTCSYIIVNAPGKYKVLVTTPGNCSAITEELFVYPITPVLSNDSDITLRF